MLFNGESVGDGSGPDVDVAVDPIDGTRLTALGYNNALSVFAVAEKGSMYDPSAVFYMEKMVVGPDAADFVDLRLPVKQNIALVAKALGKPVSQVTVCVLERARHEPLVQEIREAGARVKFIMDGDVAGAIAAARGAGVDMLLGTGGTPEGIIAACAVKATGGMLQGRLAPIDDAERQKALDAGHDLERVLTTDDLVTSDNCYFAATGITDGDLLRGVRYAGSGSSPSRSSCVPRPAPCASSRPSIAPRSGIAGRRPDGWRPAPDRGAHPLPSGRSPVHGWANHVSLRQSSGSSMNADVVDPDPALDPASSGLDA